MSTRECLGDSCTWDMALIGLNKVKDDIRGLS